jgi:hypothetical protein
VCPRLTEARLLLLLLLQEESCRLPILGLVSKTMRAAAKAFIDRYGGAVTYQSSPRRSQRSLWSAVHRLIVDMPREGVPNLQHFKQLTRLDVHLKRCVTRLEACQWGLHRLGVRLCLR